MIYIGFRSHRRGRAEHTGLESQLLLLIIVQPNRYLDCSNDLFWYHFECLQNHLSHQQPINHRESVFKILKRVI